MNVYKLPLTCEHFSKGKTDIKCVTTHGNIENTREIRRSKYLAP